MANTYTQLYVQIVFTPRDRQCIIPVKYKEDLQKYATGIIQNRKHKLLAINCMPDHVHILIGYNPNQLLTEVVRDIKAVTSKFINDHRWIYGKFEWQSGYGAFSYSRSEIDNVIKYINSQDQHHDKKNFKEEYIELLKMFNVNYDERYLFNWID